MVEGIALDSNVIGIAIGRLDLVDIKTGREEENGLATGRLQGLVDVGGDPAGAPEDA